MIILHFRAVILMSFNRTYIAIITKNMKQFHSLNLLEKDKTNSLIYMYIY